jgi:hypothetical protein
MILLDGVIVESNSARNGVFSVSSSILLLVNGSCWRFRGQFTSVFGYFSGGTSGFPPGIAGILCP